VGAQGDAVGLGKGIGGFLGGSSMLVFLLFLILILLLLGIN
jgi:hypothetical protein